jgi:hypothetical protein
MTQVLHSAFEKDDCAAEVSVTPVMQGHRNLEDSLKKIPCLALLTNPEVFQRFMAFEPLAGIELADGKQ